jgi:hypothetical protein
MFRSAKIRANTGRADIPSATLPNTTHHDRSLHNQWQQISFQQVSVLYPMNNIRLKVDVLLNSSSRNGKVTGAAINTGNYIMTNMERSRVSA